MQQTTIVMRVKPDGSTEIKVEGIAGPSCKNVTAALEKALGATTSSVPTAEMYHAVKQSHSSSARTGQ